MIHANSFRFEAAVVLVAALGVFDGWAASHTMLAGDAAGTSSFNSGVQWDDGQAPKAGDTYTATYQIRTP
ncbi:MAG: hypothetical protein LBW77_00495, partial [Verrucomicrobiota bacterium]|nr:hypothetical protein [Verrucomicrobiota bacterium]